MLKIKKLIKVSLVVYVMILSIALLKIAIRGEFETITIAKAFSGIFLVIPFSVIAAFFICINDTEDQKKGNKK